MTDLTAPTPGLRLLTAAEASEVLRIPRSTVYELTRSRRIPFVKVGRRTLFDADALAEWIRQETVLPRDRGQRWRAG